ncbi:hypothetical protein SAMN05444266_102483 [Chitinophaga jiangningensis]|uniref:Uncharacterized protein n=1 Tax=Chitinophaga jiangningensis TaxID=1419482 RepID=A0A1M6YU88_9BACT|nr:hypothetical protein [Chitinophaga jiangningensis]SHL21632.1 hypothetical protein SAMN05444266_102483 [Chitinophaga jiangningensis]
MFDDQEKFKGMLTEIVNAAVNDSLKKEFEVLDVSINQKFGKMEKKFEKRFGKVDKNLKIISGRLTTLEGRMDNLEGRMESIEGRMDNLEGRMESIEGEMKNVKVEMESMSQAVEYAGGRSDLACTHTFKLLEDTGRLGRQFDLLILALEKSCKVDLTDVKVITPVNPEHN